MFEDVKSSVFLNSLENNIIEISLKYECFGEITRTERIDTGQEIYAYIYTYANDADGLKDGIDLKIRREIRITDKQEHRDRFSVSENFLLDKVQFCTK